MNVGKLTAKLELITTQFEKSLAESERKMWRAGKRMTTAITMPILSAGGAMFVSLRKSAAWAEELENLSAKTGMSTTTLQELKYACDITGNSFEGLTNTTLMMQRKLLGIEEGGGTAATVMTRLGVKIKDDATGAFRSMNEIFPETLAALQGVENDTLRNAYASQVLGRAYGDVAPLVALTTEEMDRLKKAARDSGNVLKKDVIEALTELDDTIDKLNKTISGFIAKTTSWFVKLPVWGKWLTGIATAFLVLAGPIAQVISLATRLWPVLAAIGGGLVIGLEAVGNAVLAIGTAIAAVAASPELLTIALAAALASIIALIWKHWDAIHDVTVKSFGKTVQWIKGQVQAVIDFFKRMYDVIIGHSFVPDLISGIGRQFAKLGKLMVGPSLTATKQVAAAFGDKKLTEAPMMDLVPKLNQPKLTDKLKMILPDFKSTFYQMPQVYRDAQMRGGAGDGEAGMDPRFPVGDGGSAVIAKVVNTVLRAARRIRAGQADTMYGSGNYQYTYSPEIATEFLKTLVRLQEQMLMIEMRRDRQPVYEY